MTNYTFSVDQQGWTVNAPVAWTGTEGQPSVGSIEYPYTVTSSLIITGISIPCAIGDPVSFWCKVVYTDLGFLASDNILVRLRLIGAGLEGQTDYEETFLVEDAPYDSGWVKVLGTHDFDGTIVQINTTITAANIGDGETLKIYIDSIFIAEIEPDGATLYYGRNNLSGSDPVVVT